MSHGILDEINLLLERLLKISFKNLYIVLTNLQVREDINLLSLTLLTLMKDTLTVSLRILYSQTGMNLTGTQQNTYKNCL